MTDWLTDLLCSSNEQNCEMHLCSRSRVLINMFSCIYTRNAAPNSLANEEHTIFIVMKYYYHPTQPFRTKKKRLCEWRNKICTREKILFDVMNKYVNCQREQLAVNKRCARLPLRNMTKMIKKQPNECTLTIISITLNCWHGKASYHIMCVCVYV